MSLLEYIFFVCLRMLQRQNRQSAYSDAQGPLIFGLLCGVIAVAVVVSRLMDMDAIKLFAALWPMSELRWKFLKPVHAFAAISGVFVIFYVSRKFRYGPNTQAIELRFQSIDGEESAKRSSHVFLFLFCIFISALLVTFLPYAILLVAAALIYLERSLSNRFPRTSKE